MNIYIYISKGPTGKPRHRAFYQFASVRRDFISGAGLNPKNPTLAKKLKLKQQNKLNHKRRGILTSTNRKKLASQVPSVHN